MTPTIRPTHATRFGVAAAMSCLFALGACGGDDDNEASPSDASTSTPTTTPATTIPTTPTTTPSPTTTGTTEPVATTRPAEPTATTDPPATTTAAATTAPPTSTAGADIGTEPALCAPYLEVTAAFAGEPDPVTISALLDRIDAAAPPDIAEQLALLTDGARTVLDTGDFTVFESPEFDAAVATADTWVFENCEFVTRAEIVATEYRYAGQADEYPAGRTAFVVVNDGAEAHELAIIRKNDGVDLTLDELLELPESEAEQMTTFVGATFVASNGERSNLIVDLVPGNYLAVCNVPAGTIVTADGSFVEGTGQPHVMLGMSFEFVVT